MEDKHDELVRLGYKVLATVTCGTSESRTEGLLLERSNKLHADRQQGDITGCGSVLYIRCTGDCCVSKPLELHSAGGCIFSGNAFEAHAGRSYRKKWRETIRVMPANISLKTWLTQTGRDPGPRDADACDRRELHRFQAAQLALAAAAAAEPLGSYALGSRGGSPPPYASWRRQQQHLGGPELGEQQQGGWGASRLDDPAIAHSGLLLQAVLGPQHQAAPGDSPGGVRGAVAQLMQQLQQQQLPVADLPGGGHGPDRRGQPPQLPATTTTTTTMVGQLLQQLQQRTAPQLTSPPTTTDYAAPTEPLVPGGVPAKLAQQLLQQLQAQQQPQQAPLPATSDGGGSGEQQVAQLMQAITSILNGQQQEQQQLQHQGQRAFSSLPPPTRDAAGSTLSDQPAAAAGHLTGQLAELLQHAQHQQAQLEQQAEQLAAQQQQLQQQGQQVQQLWGVVMALRAAVDVLINCQLQSPRGGASPAHRNQQLPTSATDNLPRTGEVEEGLPKASDPSRNEAPSNGSSSSGSSLRNVSADSPGAAGASTAHLQQAAHALPSRAEAAGCGALDGPAPLAQVQGQPLPLPMQPAGVKGQEGHPLSRWVQTGVQQMLQQQKAMDAAAAAAAADGAPGEGSHRKRPRESGSSWGED